MMKRTMRAFRGLWLLGPLWLLAGVLPLAAYGDSGGSSPAPKACDACKDGPCLVRRNITDFTAAERADYVTAIQKLKQMPSPYSSSLSYYDQFVYWHVFVKTCDADHTKVAFGHLGPTFLPWHRQLVRLYEQAISAALGKSFALPYWDFTDPASTDATFRDDFMGPISGDANAQYAVTKGPVRKGGGWVINYHAPTFENPEEPDYLVRAAGTDPNNPTLPTAAMVAQAIARDVYDVAPWDITSDSNVSFRVRLSGFVGPWEEKCKLDKEWQLSPLGVIETSQLSGSTSENHNLVHGYIGGQFTNQNGARALGNMNTSAAPNDPVFFLLHVMVDKIWADWQASHPDAYEPKSGVSHNSLDDPLPVFTDTTIRSVQNISDLNYCYQ